MCRKRQLTYERPYRKTTGSMAKPTVLPASVSRRMSRVRQKDTRPELALRTELHKRGLRYRVNHVVSQKPRRTADIAFTKLKVAVFVDGCFWHGCPRHATWPRSNAAFWREKIIRNMARDAETTTLLEAAGWTVVRIWSHVSTREASDIVSRVIEERKEKLFGIVSC